MIIKRAKGDNGRRFSVCLACVVFALSAVGVTASAGTAVQDLLKSTTRVARLAPGTAYRASLIDATPNLRPAVGGWAGAQFVSHQSGKVRFETALMFWQSQQDLVTIISGPAMNLSPAATLARPRSRHFDFGAYDPPTAVKMWKVAGRQALYFDATAPPPGEWTVVGANPPELRIDHDNSFRMTALSVRGKTVVIIIEAPASGFKKFLPIATRLVASLSFPPS